LLKDLGKRGINLKVWFEGKEVNPEEDGYLGEYSQYSQGSFQLSCQLSCQTESRQTVCFTVDGKKNITPMKNHEAPGSLFRKKVPIERAANGVFTTKYPNNNFRILVLETGGNFEIWEVAVVSQDGMFFLTEQLTYQSRLFQGDNGILCPELEKWPQFLEFITPLVENQSLLSKHQTPPPAAAAKNLPRGQGIVLWWNLAMQMGAIGLDEKGTVARVHWKGIKSKLGNLRKLEAGQLVKFEKLLPVTSSRNTSFKLEAREVEVIP